MNISFMRSIDRYLGDALCFSLVLYEALARTVRNDAAGLGDIRPRKILFIKFFGIGTILLASPSIRAVRKTYPEAKILFLTFPANMELIKSLGIIDEVLAIRTDNIFLFLKDAIRALWILRKEKINVVFNMEFFVRFAIAFSYLTGARARAGFYHVQALRSELLTHQVYFNHYKHITEVFSALVGSAGVRIEDARLMKPRVTVSARRTLELLMKENSIDNGKEIVCINANSGILSLERRWPKENFIRLIWRLCDEMGRYNYVLIGDGGERAYVGEIMRGLGGNKPSHLRDLSGRLSLEVLSALFERTRLLITNDSAPLHIAVSLNTPTVSFFGPETPLLYGPPDGDSHIVFKKDLYCSPCMSAHNAKMAICNGNNVCMKLITVEEVFAGVKKILEAGDVELQPMPFGEDGVGV